MHVHREAPITDVRAERGIGERQLKVTVENNSNADATCGAQRQIFEIDLQI